MTAADFLRFQAQLPIGIEWIIILIIVALLLLFGPSKIPELARGIGKAMGEFRRGKSEVERQIRSELAADDQRDLSTRLGDAARELGIDSFGKRDSDLRLEIARRIDSAPDDRVAKVAKMLGATESGASSTRLRELIVKALGV